MSSSLGILSVACVACVVVACVVAIVAAVIQAQSRKQGGPGGERGRGLLSPDFERAARARFGAGGKRGDAETIQPAEEGGRPDGVTLLEEAQAAASRLNPEDEAKLLAWLQDRAAGKEG